jgi:hypothetical protein
MNGFAVAIQLIRAAHRVKDKSAGRRRGTMADKAKSLPMLRVKRLALALTNVLASAA